MRKRDGMVLRRLGPDAVIVAESIDMIDFDKLVSLNGSATYIWESLPDSDFSIDTLVKLLTDRYDVDEAVARRDSVELVETWMRAGIIED